MTKESNSRKNWAVLVGVNDYGHPDSNLRCCVNDMKVVENYLLQTGFSQDNVRRLTCDAENDRNLPTYSNIEREILAVCEAAGSDDFIAVFLSGHGCQHGDAPQFELPGRESISIDKIFRALGACRAKFKLLVVDACRSIRHLQLAVPGQSFRSRSSVLATDLGQLRDPPPGIVLISSCADGEVSWESGGHGVFTRCFLEGLTGKADLDKDGIISFMELCKYTVNETTSRAKIVYEAWAKENPEGAIHLKKKTQTPYIKGEYTDFPFARSFARPPEASSSPGTHSRSISTPNPINNQMTDKWNLFDGEFAKRLGPDDVSNNTFSIPLGTRALVIENGIYLGEVPMGKYTPASPPSSNGGILGWFSKFFGKEKKAEVHAVLVRQEDVPFELTLPRLLTTDDRSVDVTVRFVVQIKNITSFVQNLFGSRQLLSIREIEKTTSLIIAQGLRETIKRLSSESLDSPNVRDTLITGIQEAVHNSLLGRYGIDCADIHVAEIENEEKKELRKIQRDERENDLAVLAAHVELERSEADIALELRRNQVRKETRDVVMSDKFDEIKTAEEFKAFRLEIDKQNLLREDEWHELTTLFEAKKSDRKAARDLIARKLELDRNAELDQLKASIEHAQKVKTIQFEIELAGAEAGKWRETLKSEIAKLEHDFQKRMTQADQDREFAVKQLKYLHSEEWDKLLQQQKTKRLEEEIAEQSATAKVRRERITDEYELEKKRREDLYTDEQKRRERAFDKEVMDEERVERRTDEDREEAKDKRKADAVLEAYKIKHQQELEAQAQKNRQELDLINAKATLNTDALIATSSNPEIARALADVEKSKNESQVQSATREEMERREQESAQRERELQDQRVRDAQAANTTLSDQFSQFSDKFTQLTGQAFGAIGQFSGQPATPTQPTPGNAGTANPPVQRVIVCVQCRAENQPGTRFCPNCGKEQ